MAEKRFVSFRGLVVSLAILALVVCLASRTVHDGFYSKPTAQSTSANAKIQHRDKDASQWVSPVATFVLLLATEPSIRRPSSERTLLELRYDSLYDRPPPIS